jgi:hypothetical protein
VTQYHHPSWTDNGSFRPALDDVIIIPFVFVGLAASQILRFIPLFAAKVLGDGIVAIINGRVALPSTFRDEASTVE